jgi:hypothetical protein
MESENFFTIQAALSRMRIVSATSERRICKSYLGWRGSNGTHASPRGDRAARAVERLQRPPFGLPWYHPSGLELARPKSAAFLLAARGK